MLKLSNHSSTADSIAPEEASLLIRCLYINTTSQVQIARIDTARHLERVVFPGQRLLFEANPEDLLEIHSNELATAILCDKIACHRLQM